jgi:Amidohydrolase family
MRALRILTTTTYLFLCTTVLAKSNSTTNLIYTEKGLAGKQVVIQESENEYKGTLDVGWNNRVFKINETVTTNEKGLPIKFTATGVSPFGAPIDEKFTWQDGIATWESNKEDGQLKALKDYFYLPANSAGAVENLLVRSMLKSMTNSVELIPSGTARLKKLKTITITNGDLSNEVSLYALSGLDFNPDFSWYDSEGNFFAKDISGFLRIIREGYNIDNFNTLRDIQNDAEHEYLANLNSELSHGYQSLIIKNTNVVDVIESKVLESVDVLLRKGKIASISKNITIDKKTLVVDGNGKTLIPGLWDMHGHLSKEQGILNIAAGVTSVRDIGNSHENIMNIAQLFNNDELIGNRVYRAGFMDQMSEFSAGLSVSSLEEAHEKIDWFADNGYLQVKLYSSIDPTWVESISEHVHRRGMRLSGHIPAFMTAEQAVKAGYDEIQHINMLFLNFLAGTTVDTRKQLRFSLVGEKAGELDLDSKEVNDFVQMLADKKIVIDPTVSTFRSLLLKAKKQIDPEFASIADHLPPNVVRQIKGAEMNVAPEHINNYRAGAEALSALVKKLYDFGVPMVAGTDNIAGFTLQRELELYVEAGIPAIDVFKIASIDSAKLVGAAYYTGSISKGKYADIVLIDGDPIKNIADIRKVSLVVKGEHYFRPDELHKAIGVKPFVTSAPFE